MSDTSIHLHARHGRLSALVAAVVRPILSLYHGDGAPPPGTSQEFRDPATWREVRKLPPHLLRDIGFYD